MLSSGMQPESNSSQHALPQTFSGSQSVPHPLASPQHTILIPRTNTTSADQCRFRLYPIMMIPPGAGMNRQGKVNEQRFSTCRFPGPHSTAAPILFQLLCSRCSPDRSTWGGSPERRFDWRRCQLWHPGLGSNPAAGHDCTRRTIPTTGTTRRVPGKGLCTLAGRKRPWRTGSPPPLFRTQCIGRPGGQQVPPSNARTFKGILRLTRGGLRFVWKLRGNALEAMLTCTTPPSQCGWWCYRLEHTPDS